MIVGLLHPGEMGSAVGAALRGNGHDVLWASSGRSDATVRRAREADLSDAGSIEALLAEAEVVLSIVPPHAAPAVAAEAAGFEGIFVDANAISPATVRSLAPRQVVDGSIVGPPPHRPGTTRLYLSGEGADAVAALFTGSTVEARIVEGGIGAASALKMAYAAWSKGTAAMLLAIRDVARADGVEEHAARGVGRLGAGAARAAAAGRACGRREGLALDRRDGGDRRHLRGSRTARGLPPCSRPGLSRVGDAVIRARQLAKRYGDRRVFRDLDFDVATGGFLLVTGPNGSGKTTLLRVLAGLAAPSAGELQLPERRQIGYLGHEPLVYRELTPLENLTLFGRLYRVPERAEQIGMLLERFGLWEARHERVSTFSRGMQQRLGLCRVLLHAPSLLVLDEPSNALDAGGLELLDGAAGETGRTCVVATHEPQRVERFATDRLAFA